MNALQVLQTQLKEINREIVTASGDELLMLLEHQTELLQRIEKEQRHEELKAA